MTLVDAPDAGFAALADRLWAAVEHALPAGQRDRIRGLLDGFAGRAVPVEVAAGQYVNPRLHVPGLTARPWHDPCSFPECELLTARFSHIGQELNGLLAQPHLWHQAVGPEGAGSGTVVSADLHGWWATYYLHRDFRRLAASVVHCPVTMASLPEDAVSREAMFSLIGPGTYIAPHSDLVNFVVTVYLPLVTPAGSWLRAGETAVFWQAGVPVAFDSTFRHDSANPTGSPRVILIVDLWHPELTAAERRALARVSPVMNDALRGAAQAVSGHGS